MAVVAPGLDPAFRGAGGGGESLLAEPPPELMSLASVRRDEETVASEALDELSALRGMTRGLLRLATVESVSVSILPDMLLHFAQAYPRIQVAVTVAGSDRGSPTLIPASRYWSPEWYEREIRDMWPRTWHIACSVDHVAEPVARQHRDDPLEAGNVLDGRAGRAEVRVDGAQGRHDAQHTRRP